jgi:predicted RNA-binding protein with EMAP domain
MKEITHLMADLADLLGIAIEWDLRYVSVEDATDYYGGFQVTLNRGNLEAIIKAVEKLNKGDK